MNRQTLRSAAVPALLLLLAGCAGGDPRLAERLDLVLDRLADRGAVVYARVIELPGGRELYARNPDRPCVPASNFKLLTTATGLDLLGPKFRAATWLAVDGDDLWIIGTGDPGTGDYRLARAAGKKPVSMLEEWAEQLGRRGIREIKGDLVYQDDAFEDQPRVHPSWPRPWLLHWYAAPTTGLCFNDNSVDITVFPTEPGKPVRYEVMPPVGDIQVINECLTGGGGHPAIAKLKGGNIYRISGSCSRRTELMSKPVEDPGAFFADALRTQLAAKGILVRGRIRRAASPFPGGLPPRHDRLIAAHETPIESILSRINKNSQNLFAECLCKMNGRAFDERRGRPGPGSWQSGGEAVRAFLRRNLIDDRALRPVDGSGLSPDNRVSVRMLTDVLAVMHGRRDAEVYRASLTAAGVDGSLKDRMSDLAGHVFGKTGYIGGVSSISGYVKTNAGRWLAFSFIYNEIPEKAGDDQDVQAYTRLQDEACRILAGWPQSCAGPASRPATSQPGSSTPAPLVLKPCTDPRFREIEPDDSHYLLVLAGRELGMVSFRRDGSISEMMLFNDRAGRILTLKGEGESFPASMSLDVLADPASPDEAMETLMDDDLDGIPDRRMDWGATILSRRDEITWRPTAGTSTPAASRPKR